MMTTNVKRFGTVAVSAIAATSMLSGVAVSFAATDANEAADVQAEAAVSIEAAPLKTLDTVEGVFTYNQTDLSSLHEIQRALGVSAKYLCGSQFVGVDNSGVTDAHEWSLVVDGAVSQVFEGTVGDLANTVGEARIAMGCACMGNPAGGFSTISAEVTGVMVRAIMGYVQPESGVNTVVFTSADGYEVALPLAYVYSRPSVIAYSINGASMDEAFGGQNQLWIGTTAARYFCKDVVHITFEKRDHVPATPGTPEAGDTYANIPGIGVTKGAVE